MLAMDLASGRVEVDLPGAGARRVASGLPVRSAKSGPNCPSAADSVLKDYDFGAGVVIGKRRNGRDILVAGQKSGDLWGLDPDAQGKVCGGGRSAWGRRSAAFTGASRSMTSAYSRR